MSRQQKFLSRLRTIPNDVKFDELINFLKAIGFKVHSGGKGSHFTVSYEDFRFTIPRHKNIGEVYIEKLIEEIDLREISIK